MRQLKIIATLVGGLLAAVVLGYLHDLLAEDVRFWRMVLGSSDLLIDKMIAVVMFHSPGGCSGNDIAKQGSPGRGGAGATRGQ
jgi:hypothetical protein